MLLAERLDRRNAVDVELTRILQRPPVSMGSSRTSTIDTSNWNVSLEPSYNIVSARDESTIRRQPVERNHRSEQRTTMLHAGVLPIGHENDKETEQAAKRRYQRELQEQIRESRMRKFHAKQEKDIYEQRLQKAGKNYDYFGRSGGGAPMRDKDGNVVANLADLRNPQGTSSQMYTNVDEKNYSIGGNTNTITTTSYLTDRTEPYSMNSVCRQRNETEQERVSCVRYVVCLGAFEFAESCTWRGE
jgi:hypothetical protein